MWTIAERAATAYRITLERPPRIETFPIEGVPVGSDLEGIAVLGDGRYALGTEGQDEGVATVLLAERRGGSLAVTSTIALSGPDLGIALIQNQGVEGVCGAGETIVAGLEGSGESGGRRWAPLAVIEHGRRTRTHRLWLTTATGKLSGLDCRVAADGTIRGWAIERHFEVTKILRFELGATPEVTPTVALDLGPTLRGRLNLEGIAELADGRIVAVIDNQWRTITGPSELLLFDRAVFAR